MRVFLVSLFFVSMAVGADMPKGTAPEWLKYTTPGKEHQMLKDLAGRWTYELKFWGAPDTEPQVSKGSSSSKMILGGRFLDEETRGTVMGQAFNGRGFTGYDSFTQKYQMVWMDNMGTTMVTSSGTLDPATGIIKCEGTMSDPMTGVKDSWFRSELKVLNKNFHSYAMFGKNAEGKEFKMMEIGYKRVN